MKYTETNKQAWEHAFDNRIEGFGDKDSDKLKANQLAFHLKICSLCRAKMILMKNVSTSLHTHTSAKIPGQTIKE